MILTKQDSIYAANKFQEFFFQLNRIDDYLRKVKLERMKDIPAPLPGMSMEDDFFWNFSISPEDMEFIILEGDDSWHEYMEITTSAPVERSIPGKQLKLTIKEKNTKKVVGMIRFGSPTINSKPRNDWLGGPLQTTKPLVMNRFNRSAIMGFNIVPVQPFGFNYLGGKLLAGICCSHEIRELLNKKYKDNNANICLFETTSLYGSTKSMSQYDGMKPFLRFNGLTDSNFIPMINDDNFRNLNDWFSNKFEEPLVAADATSRKLKLQTKMISIIKASMKKHGLTNELEKFNESIEHAKGLTERKRSFYCTYGFSNVPDYLNFKTETLKKKDNFDRFYMEEIVKWWRNKAVKRYENLVKEGTLRTEIESWFKTENIDIIR